MSRIPQVCVTPVVLTSEPIMPDRRKACAQKELKNGKKMIQHMELIHRRHHFGDTGYVPYSRLTAQLLILQR